MSRATGFKCGWNGIEVDVSVNQFSKLEELVDKAFHKASNGGKWKKENVQINANGEVVTDLDLYVVVNFPLLTSVS